MIFQKTELAGCYIIEAELARDDRGFFARTFDIEEFQNHGLTTGIAQCSTSFNPSIGTLRGLHYQVAPFQESKLVRCTSGRIFDVAVDLRPSSTTFGRWVGVSLGQEDRRSFYIPEGCAHGFITLAPDSEVSYSISAKFNRKASRGLRWNDPAVRIRWPMEPRVISNNDLNRPDFQASS